MQIKKKIVVAHRLTGPLLATLRDCFEVVHFPEPVDARGKKELLLALRDAEGYIGSNLAFSATELDEAPLLRVIASVSVGVDYYPLDYLRRRGIVLTNTPDVLTQTTADLGFALLMAAARRLCELDRYVCGGRWQGAVSSAHFGVDVYAKVLGVVGMGRIGQALCRRGCDGFDMPLVFSNPSPKPDVEARFEARQMSVQEVFSQADFICITTPLTERTRGMVNRDLLARVKPGAILINISRGPVVEESALIEALQSGRLRAAALDVFEHEPLPMDSPLLRMDNVIRLPHVGSATRETRERMATCAVSNLIEALAGRPAPDTYL